jgi:hypothetical protein
MKKLILSLVTIFVLTGLAFGQSSTVNLNGVTFGFGAGPAYSFDQVYDYSLTTDAAHNLKLQPLNKGAFAIASVLMVKLGSIATDVNNESQIISQSKTEDYLKAVGDSHKTVSGYGPENFFSRCSIDLAINLADISSTTTFNKNVNGGIGFGYFITSNLQCALFYDISQVSQLRDYVAGSYLNKPIPDGASGNYTTLSTSDSNLFYNKTISGLSFKLVFSIGNQKANSVKPTPSTPTTSTPPTTSAPPKS